MKKRSGIIAVLLFVISLCCINANVAHAKSRPLSLDQAVALIKKDTGSKVLSAKEVTKAGERFYLIKTMNNGRVRLIRINPKTGQQY